MRSRWWNTMKRCVVLIASEFEELTPKWIACSPTGKLSEISHRI